MILIATALYLPQHIAFLMRRAFFYYHGDDIVTSAKAGLPHAAAQTGMRLRDAVDAVRGHTVVEKVVRETVQAVSDVKAEL